MAQPASLDARPLFFRLIEFGTRVLDGWFDLLSVAVMILVLWLNAHTQGMDGLLPCHEDFGRIIRAGFDPAAALRGTPTFPMWGYGWLMLITERAGGLLFIQCTLALVAMAIFVRALARRRWLSLAGQRSFKLLCLALLPWFGLHSLRDPKSIAASLLLIAIIGFASGWQDHERSGRRWIWVSGLAFGLMLNFRSDFYLLPIAWLGFGLLCKERGQQLFLKVGPWFGIILLCMTPWLTYTKVVSGRVHLTSTNAGHVLYIGLGQLPENPWGIQPIDADPRMYEALDRHFGRRVPSCHFEADPFLKRLWWEEIERQPQAFARKVIHNGVQCMTRGAYAGDFYFGPEASELAARAGLLASAEAKLRYLCQVESGCLSVALIFVSYLLSPFIAWRAIRDRDILALVVLAVLGYQLLLSAIGYFLTVYNSGVVVLHGLSVIRFFPRLRGQHPDGLEGRS